MLSLLLLVYPNIASSQDKAAEVVMVPFLINQHWDQASQTLRAMGLKARRVAPPEDCDQRQLSQVLSQRPEAGELVRQGTTVTLVTCQPAVIDWRRQVPDLSGLDLGTAKMRLQKLDLKLRVTYRNSCAEPFLQNKIIAQKPPPLSVVKRGTLVWVSICRYKP